MKKNKWSYRNRYLFAMKLYCMGVEKKEIQKIIKHERAHFDKARELGYYAYYLIKRSNDGVPSCWVKFYSPNKQPIPKKDLREILLAPRFLSISDINTLNSLVNSE